MSVSPARRRSAHTTPTAIAITLVYTATSFLAARMAWADWTLIAIAVAGFSFSGGIRFWPWGIGKLRPLGIGLFVGLAAATAEFLIFPTP